ncbi:glycoside hydrolase [Trametes meyenii]|nr:glycoside hydrolase [Trametes meyenii]
MVLTAGNFTLLLQSLGLMQGTFKPVPTSHVGDVGIPSQSKLAAPPSASDFGDNYQSHALGNAPGLGDFNKVASDCTPRLYDPPDLGNPTFPPFDTAKATIYRYRQQQSVNLGSWFVHEQWMTPSLFTCAAGDKISELDIASGWGSIGGARAVLEHHWDTFITATDFQYLAGIGINTVRLPIGYWNLGPSFCEGTPFEPVADVYQTSWSRVVRTINMASESGIGVLVDLHGAPGSQNGQPHSGISDGKTGLFDNDWYINKTLAVLTFLTEELVNVTNVVGIQILNEPQNVDSLPAFYTQAISTMRQTSSAAQSFPLYIHDGFSLDQYSAFVGNRSDFVVQDHHSYFVFMPGDSAEPASQHTKDIHGTVTGALDSASELERRNMVVDEFSCALTTQSLVGEDDPERARMDFCTGQMELYQNEDCSDDPGWCFKAAVGKSLPPSFFSYGKGPLADPSRLPALSDMAVGMYAPSHEDPVAALSPNMAASPDTLTSSPKVGLFPVNRRSRLRLRRSVKAAARRDNAEQLPLDPSQRAITKGYSDGFLTAKIFALYGMSKLGFAGQYVNDSLARLDSGVIVQGHEQYYSRWFMEGLADGEALISASVNNTGI